MHHHKRGLLACALAVSLLFSGCGIEEYISDLSDQSFGGETEVETEDDVGCTVYFLDVGQGDSTLIVTEDAAVLIDAGEQSAGDDVLADLQAYGVTELDWIICTHPHADHIGGFSVLLEYAATYDDLTIDNVMLPDIPDDQIPTTMTYEYFLDGVEENGLTITVATETTLDLGGATLDIIPPPGDDYSSLNDYSICAYLHCGETSFLFTGDASSPEENDLVEQDLLTTADVLKVGHHGSGESSTTTFLSVVQPEYAIISCGIDNSYGHPDEETLERLEVYCGDAIYRTDEDGTVIVASNGSEITITTTD